MEGLKLSGAVCRSNQLFISGEILTNLHLTKLRWIRLNNDDRKENMIELPVYLNATREQLLFTIDLPVSQGEEMHEFRERGVAIISSTALT